MSSISTNEDFFFLYWTPFTENQNNGDYGYAKIYCVSGNRETICNLYYELAKNEKNTVTIRDKMNKEVNMQGNYLDNMNIYPNGCFINFKKSE